MSEPRAMVLMAGLATRLRPLSDTLPKPLAPILGVPLADHTLDQLARAGIRDVVVNLHHLPEVAGPAVQAAAAERGLRVTLLEERAALLGTGGGVKNAEPQLAGASVIVVVNGDSFLEVDIGQLVREHLNAGADATLLVRHNPDPRTYLPVEADAAGRVHCIAGRPARTGLPATTPWLFAGVHVLLPAVLAHLPEGVASDINRVLHPELIARGQLVRAASFDGPWWDLGTPGRLLTANLEALATPPPRLAEIARDRGVHIAGGSAIASPSRVARSATVTRSVIGRDATIGDRARVDRCLLLAGVAIGTGATIRQCVIGAGVRVEPGATLVRQLVCREGTAPIGGPLPD